MRFTAHRILLIIARILIIIEMAGGGLYAIVETFILASSEYTISYGWIPLVSFVFGALPVFIGLLFLIKALIADYDAASYDYYVLKNSTNREIAKANARIDALERSMMSGEPLVLPKEEKQYKPQTSTRPAAVAKKEEAPKKDTVIDYDKIKEHNNGPIYVGSKVVLKTNYVVGGVRYEKGSVGIVKDIKKFSSFTTYAVAMESNPTKQINVTGDNLEVIK